MKLKQMLKKLQFLFNLSFLVLLGVFMLFTPITFAQQNCDVPKEISIGTIFSPANFTPLIPASCANSIAALGLGSLPDVAIRTYGFFASLGMYLLTITTLVAGIVWISGGFDEGQVGQAKKIMQNAVIGILILVSSYTVIIEILNLVLGDGGGTALLQTDVRGLFSRGR